MSKCCLRCTTLSAVAWKRVLVDMRKDAGSGKPTDAFAMVLSQLA